MILTKSRLQTLASNPLLKHNWHYLAASILSVCNKPKEIPGLYLHAMDTLSSSSEKELVTSRFREALLKAAALIGLPRTINALTELKNVTPEALRAYKVLRRDEPSFHEVGERLFGNVYGKITGRIHHQLSAAYPDLDWFVIRHEYGPLLSFSEILDAKETSLVIVASLVPQSVNPQLKGHLKGALNQGNTMGEVNAVRDMALEMALWCGIECNEVARL